MQNNEKKVIELNINDVLPNRFQPRIMFDENSINELALSIKRYGVIQPIVVRKIGEKYEIIAGERRYKASVIAGNKTIPAIVCELNDIDSIEIALIENVQREDLTPIEKAISYKKILDTGFIKQEVLAQRVGKSQSSVANTLRLLNLTEDVQEALLENKISERHARSLLKIKDDKTQIEMLKKIIEERLTVRKTDKEIEEMLNNENNINTQVNNETTLTKEVVNIPDVEMNNIKNNYMPGFMDIDKIETDAKDINIEPKQVANIENLLQGDTNFVSTSMPAKSTSEEELLKPEKFFNFLEPEEKNSSEQKEIEPQFNIENFFTLNNQEVMPQVATQPETPSMPAYEEPSMNNIPIMPTIEVPNTPIVNSYETESLAIPETISVNTSASAVPNIRVAVNTIRECETTLNKYGFNVDVEEIDFEDSYQVIFKISK